MPKPSMYSQSKPFVMYRIFNKAQRKINSELVRRVRTTGKAYTKQDVVNLMLESYVPLDDITTAGLAANTISKKR